MKILNKEIAFYNPFTLTCKLGMLEISIHYLSNYYYIGYFQPGDGFRVLCKRKTKAEDLDGNMILLLTDAKNYNQVSINRTSNEIIKYLQAP